MDDAHLPWKATRKTTNRLWREGNLRYKDNGLLAALDDFLCSAQINFCFAGACHTLQEKGGTSLG